MMVLILTTPISAFLNRVPISTLRIIARVRRSIPPHVLATTAASGILDDVCSQMGDNDGSVCVSVTSSVSNALSKMSIVDNAASTVCVTVVHKAAVAIAEFAHTHNVHPK